jgi:hypothetical protein
MSEGVHPGEFALGNLAAFVEGRATCGLRLLCSAYGPRLWLRFRDKKALRRLLEEIVDEARWEKHGGARVREMHPRRLESVAVVGGDDYFWMGDQAPRDGMGVCKACRQHWSQGHLGTCSWSLMRGAANG